MTETFKKAFRLLATRYRSIKSNVLINIIYMSIKRIRNKYGECQDAKDTRGNCVHYCTACYLSSLKTDDDVAMTTPSIATTSTSTTTTTIITTFTITTSHLFLSAKVFKFELSFSALCKIFVFRFLTQRCFNNTT
jgi:hypothetical protein